MRPVIYSMYDAFVPRVNTLVCRVKLKWPGLSAAAERRRRRVILSRRTPPVHPRRTSAYGVYFVISK